MRASFTGTRWCRTATSSTDAAFRNALDESLKTRLDIRGGRGVCVASQVSVWPPAAAVTSLPALDSPERPAEWPRPAPIRARRACLSAQLPTRGTADTCGS